MLWFFLESHPWNRTRAFYIFSTKYSSLSWNRKKLLLFLVKHLNSWQNYSWKSKKNFLRSYNFLFYILCIELRFWFVEIIFLSSRHCRRSEWTLQKNSKILQLQKIICKWKFNSPKKMIKNKLFCLIVLQC